MEGWGIVLALMFIILFGPAIIIVLSKRVAGWKKVRWVMYSLLPLFIIPVVSVAAIMLILPAEKKNLAGLYATPIMSISTYISVWLILLIFHIKTPRIPKG